MDWEHSFRKRWMTEGVGSVPRKRTYRCDKTIDLEDLIAEENRKFLVNEVIPAFKRDNWLGQNWENKHF